MKVQKTLWRAGAVAALGFCGIVAAFATIAPSADSEQPPQASLVVEEIPIRLEEAQLPAPESYVREERLQRGDTLAGVLSRLGIDEADAHRLLRARVLSPLRPGSLIDAKVGREGELRELSFLTGRETLVKIQPEGENFRATEERAALDTTVAMKSSLIRSSLFAATDSAGIPDSVASQLADIFAGDIDFHRDLRKGDRFSVIYEEEHFTGRAVRAGRVLAAEFVNQGRVYRAVQFENGYYAPDGKNLRKAFLRSPLEFSRVSSGFGLRMHPFMRTWRAHKGIDYAAPIGTRVRAVGDAFVEYAGPKNGYGNVLVLRHQGQYSTIYAHLSRIAVRRGARVAQNDTIGYVGQTGWATGPHLHYEFRIGGEARNPLALALPAASPISAEKLHTFAPISESMVERLDLLATSNVALLN